MVQILSTTDVEANSHARANELEFKKPTLFARVPFFVLEWVEMT